MEIHNESLNDLLKENNRNLDIRETKDGKVQIPDLTQIRVSNVEELV